MRTQQSGTVIFPVPVKENINIRRMTIEDLEMVMQWAQEEGWNPGRYESRALYAADPTGYYLLEVDKQPVASLAIVRYSHQFAFLGLYIVKREYRKQGYGKLLWDHCMGNNCMGNNYTAGLNAVTNQVSTYQKSGFASVHNNTRWRGKVPALVSTSSSSKLLSNVPVSSLISYNQGIFSAPRLAFLEAWLKMPESHVLAAMDGKLVKGYGVISSCQEGYKIAPLFADNEQIACDLYRALCRCIGDKEAVVYLDTTAENTEGEKFATLFGLEKTFDTVRMYRGDPPVCSANKVFGLTSLEIG